MSPIPEIPGAPIPRHSQQEQWLRQQVSRLCNTEHQRFPGAQPVSFNTRDLDKLEREDFWVCEKSDGVRVLLLVLSDLTSNDQAVYLIDRHNSYRSLSGLFFPHHDNPGLPLQSTLVDGELVVDVDPHTKHETLRYLAFDCLVVDNQNVMMRPLDKRYGRLTEWFYKPYVRMIKDHPHMRSSAPFDVKVKGINSSYNVEKVFDIDIPALQHGNDGLIYTCVNSPYTSGTDPNIMKWKPPSENSIDFKLILRFPPLSSNPREPDFCAKPVFMLHVWLGDGDRGQPRYEPFDELYVDDNEWEEMKLSGEQFDDRIVEVHWDPTRSCWRYMRFRDDKPNGNHKSVVDNIIQSIADGVEKDALLARSNAIRAAWKQRQPPPGGQPQQQNSRLGQPAQAPHRTHQRLDLRFGPLAPSIYSKVGGPPTIAGVSR